ncbi:hypothetical protein BIV57_01080 [Mangrovactinospora gilvigrisea]|uniref:Uncharacterized protein n=1 Tax=Mangrovactinospora gilvigrisea TaxID=1428644 RepID=A0A1J7C149_9ACTN|nr:hypothetical protein [Mangrovactinospora gilvigrisea]OIV39457.1 hypothetical protein BIV57_01080 [Mangrovactinospora gilvigrisea]
MTTNPWQQLGDRAPFVVPADRPHLQAFNAALSESRRGPYGLDVSLPPEPHLGLHDAPLVILLANPGRSEADDAQYARAEVRARTLAGITAPKGTPHPWLAPDVAAEPGGRWWRRTLAALLPLGHTYRELASKVLAVQFHGYHSPAWHSLPITLPSQAFGFGLVEKAVERGAVIVLLRPRMDWSVAVPGLGSYARLLRVRSRSTAISPGNLGEAGFKMVADALAG